ncbi:acyl carrier protein [Spongiactinospora sp. 9N601]|uniref:acyl carrier protein n=1 Tax=Spongiactinospora sp. 9N601 TaxID=3375149 RepID=UPI0037BB2C70
MGEPISVQEMTEIWRAVLRDQSVRPDTDFFDLGGHSLAAIRIAQQIETACGIRLPPSAIHDNPTPERLAVLVGRHLAEAD